MTEALAKISLVIFNAETLEPSMQDGLADGPINIKQLRARLVQAIDSQHTADWQGMRLEGESVKANATVSLAPAACQFPHFANPHCPVSDSDRRFSFHCNTNNVNCATNRKRWNFSDDDSCKVCNSGQAESTRHALNACNVRLTNGLYLARHDAVLRTLHRVIASAKPSADIRIDGWSERGFEEK